MKISENSRKILEKRYLIKKDGKPIEKPIDMFKRIAKAVAEAEKKFKDPKIDIKTAEKRFLDLMTKWDFLPNSPTLMNAGRELGQLSACFVLPVEDSMDKIFTAVKNAALIHKSGGGTGFTFTHIRPKNSPVKSTGGVASGPVSFMKVFNAATEAIKQGGTRRGANMGILRVDHPDILEFISCKQDNNELTNFNISIGLTSEFMDALKNNGYYDLKFNNKIYDRYKAKEIFDKIIERAWSNGEPGIVFLDRLNSDNPTPELADIEATNPCGEQPLLPYEACNLGSINLSNMVTDNEIDWDKLEDTVYWSVRFLDNVVEINNFPLQEIEKIVFNNRKIGLGIMGWANLLFKMRIPYESEKSIELAEKVMGFIKKVSDKASREIAEERGNFPNIEYSIFKGEKMRNATRTTIAPTGTISMIAESSSGIEPVFALAYTKNVMDGENLVEVNPIFEKYIYDNYDEIEAKKIIDKVAEEGSIKNISSIPEDIKNVFVTALEIKPEWHIRMQAAFQKNCDNAVSKTVNFPYEATKEDVEKVYMLAYDLGCKNVKKAVVVDTDKIFPRPRSKRTYGVTEQVKTGCGKMYITVNYDKKGMIETFITTGSSGGCSGFTEGISRMISLALRANISPEAIIDQLTSVSCPTFLRKKAMNPSIEGKSCPDIIGKVLAKEFEINKPEIMSDEDINILLQKTASQLSAATTDEKDLDNLSEDELIELGICPDCKRELVFSEGCLKCDCGFSRCG
jgi:ribonucleoside-diphosphate reductase alpha chain